MSKLFRQSWCALKTMLMGVVAVLSFVVTAYSMPLPHWPIDYVVLKSQTIVQGHFVDEKHLFVDKVFLGNAVPLETILIRDRFSLSRIANDPDRECDPIHETNRFSGKPCRSVKQEAAVAFLERSNGGWELTGWGSGLKWLVDGKTLGYSQFSVPGPYVLVPDSQANTAEDLYRAIERALEKRARFMSALQKNPKERIEGLLPFVQDAKEYLYWKDALHALAATGPGAGATLHDLAEKLKGEYARIEVLKSIGETRDKNSTTYLTEIVVAARPALADFGLQLPPPQQRQAAEEWLASLCSISMLADARNLPLLRNSLLDTFGVGEFYGSQARTCVESGLMKNPAPDNLVNFQKAYELYPRWYRWEGSTKWASWGALNFLTAHKFKQAIPLMAEQLDHPEAASRDHFHRLLIEIVGRDLGESKGPWLEWYAQYHQYKRLS